MNKPTDAQFEKLAKWALEYIRDLERQRETAVRALTAWTDSQTQSPISIPEMECIGGDENITSMVRYIEGRRVEFDWAGVHLSVLLREDAIDLQWHRAGRTSLGDVCMQPRSYQQIYLIAKDKMR